MLNKTQDVQIISEFVIAEVQFLLLVIPAQYHGNISLGKRWIS